MIDRLSSHLRLMSRIDGVWALSFQQIRRDRSSEQSQKGEELVDHHLGRRFKGLKEKGSFEDEEWGRKMEERGKKKGEIECW